MISLNFDCLGTGRTRPSHPRPTSRTPAASQAAKPTLKLPFDNICTGCKKFFFILSLSLHCFVNATQSLGCCHTIDRGLAKSVRKKCLARCTRRYNTFNSVHYLLNLIHKELLDQMHLFFSHLNVQT